MYPIFLSLNFRTSDDASLSSSLTVPLVRFTISFPRSFSISSLTIVPSSPLISWTISSRRQPITSLSLPLSPCPTLIILSPTWIFWDCIAGPPGISSWIFAFSSSKLRIAPIPSNDRFILKFQFSRSLSEK